MGLGRRLEKGQECDGGEVYGGNVGVEDTIPTLKVLVAPKLLFQFTRVGAVRCGFGPRNTSVGDYNELSELRMYYLSRW